MRHVSSAVFVLLSTTVALWNSLLLAHPDIEETGLLFHFAPGVHAIKNGTLADLTHAATARMEGKPTIASMGPTEAFVLNGTTDWLTIAGSVEDAKEVLPTQAMTVATWVNVASYDQEWGGICGLFQDNGNAERGWVLSRMNDRFTFGLSTQGADDGDGKMTYLTSKSALEIGHWYYVVATYDGTTMKLYVNGKLDNQSTEQSGNIHYPASGIYTIGNYKDDNENFPFHGAIFEAKVFNIALAEKEIAAVATKNSNLIEAEPTVDLTMIVQPYLQFGTQTSMTIMCETNVPTKMTVEFARRQPLQQRVSTSEPKLISELTIDKLEPNTAYFYRVTCEDSQGRSVTSEQSSFQTAPTADMPWAFTIIGDTQRNPEVTRKCAESAYALRPNFMLHCGDVVDNGHAKNQWIKDLFEPMSVLTSRVPMFPVIGNHEGNSHWYYDYFSLPKPEYCYTFEYGNAQFFMIDSNKSLAKNSEQYQWLEDVLSKSKATWKITCHHHPCYTSDNDDYGDREKGERNADLTWGDKNAQNLVPLYEKYGVDFAFNGHVHNYERTWPIYGMTINQKKGVRYITSGGGGGHLERAAPQRAWFSLHYRSVYHICYATVHERTIQFKAIDLEGKMFDMFELTKADDR